MSQYTIDAGGSDAPRQPRCHQDPPRGLVEKCLLWMEEQRAESDLQAKYALAARMVQGLRTSVGEASSTLLHPEIIAHPAYTASGLFLSALHNDCVDEPRIIFDLEADVDYIAYASSRLFINRGIVGDNLGMNSKETVINAGIAREGAGTYAALIINTGSAGQTFGSWGYAINAGDAGPRMGFGSGCTLINLGNAGEDFASSAYGRFIMLEEPASYGNRFSFKGEIPREFLKSPRLSAIIISEGSTKKISAESAKHISEEAEQFLRTLANDAKARPERIEAIYGNAMRIRSSIEAKVRS